MIWLLAAPAILPMWSDWRRNRIALWQIGVWFGYLIGFIVIGRWHPGWSSLLGLVLGFGLTWMGGLPGGDRYVFAILGAIVGPVVIALSLTMVAITTILLLPFWSRRILILETPLLPWWVPITMGIAAVIPSA